MSCKTADDKISWFIDVIDEFYPMAKPFLKCWLVKWIICHFSKERFAVVYSLLYYTVGHKKCGTLLLFISSPIIDRFSKFFDCQTLHTICYNGIIIYPSPW